MEISSLFKKYQRNFVYVAEVTHEIMIDLALMFYGRVEDGALYLPGGKRFREGDLINHWGNHVLDWNWAEWEEAGV